MKVLLTIIIVNYNTSVFVLNSLHCLERLTKNPYKVIIRDNNSKLKDYLNLKKKIKNFQNVELYRVENFYLLGSFAHGTALNDLVNKIDTEYGVILDADFAFLHKNWDEILINQLNEKYPIIGTEGIPTKFQDFPYVYAILFKSKVMQNLDIDFLPGDINIDPKFDTGFKVRDKFLKRGYKGKMLEYKNTVYYKDGPFCTVNCQEFYLKEYDHIFGTHFFRGSAGGKWKYAKIYVSKLEKIPIIGKYLIKNNFIKKVFLYKLAGIKGWIDTHRWISICKDILNEE